MYSVPELTSINGVLLVDDQPFPDQEILFISENMDKFLGASLTNSAGQFSFAFPPEGGLTRAILLVKVKSDIVTLSQNLVEIPQTHPIEIHIDTKKQFFNLEGKVESSVGWPDYLHIFLDPVQVAGISDRLEPFFKQRDHGVFDAHFREITVHARTFHFKVKAGRYRIGGQYINYDRPMMVTPDFKNYIVDKAYLVPELSSLPGNPEYGFILDVDADKQIVLSLRVVEDEEL